MKTDSPLIRQLIHNANSGDVVLLELECSEHNPVGYIWGDEEHSDAIMVYPTSGTATSYGEEFDEINQRGIDIADGNYLGMKISHYEILRRG